jgi:type I restriction-modification system DNA methylase subunit
MALFQQSVIKKHISDLDENKLQQGWNHFESYFKDNAQQQKITDSKEEQFQYPFLDNLFDKCLGYTIDGSEQNLFTEFKNVTDSKKADGAIKINDEVVAVIELKSTKTKDFNKIQEQAFGYKVSHPNCKYVVTSNFNKLRFYIENATAFEEFDLFNLTNERFKLLWLCLSFESVSSGIPLKIKSESTLNEENITKKLYKDYSLFRKEVFNDIVEKNQQYDKLTLFNKTQKLLDRFLFIFFAEDRRLLPVNSISKIIEKWEDDIAYGDEKSLYTSFKLYFNLLNKGRAASAKREEIFAYNGGLFAPDEILNSITIDDKLLSKHTKQLTTYDFESDVSVNILGHIFEHSLSEIEEIQNEITGAETDKTSSKRKKDGVFYTPSYITKYIVENTVGKLCQEKKEELEINEEVYTQRKARSKKRIDNLDTYRNWLLGITICDPACGSGAFLVQALDFLIEEHKYIDELNAAYHGASIPFSDITSSILENNLYGVDINGESVEIAKLSLWLRTAQKGRKLTSLNSNIKCGNSLIDDPEVAGDKAFNWKNEFPEVFTNGGFDVVIGNPPYVRQELFKEIKPYLEQHYKCYNSVADLYTYFIEKGIRLMNERGLFSFILPNKFLKATYGKNIRKIIKEQSNLELLLDFDDFPVFADATTYPIIYVVNKVTDFSEDSFMYAEINKRDNTVDPINLLESKKHKVPFASLTEDMWNFIDVTSFEILNKIKSDSTQLGKVVNKKIYRGLTTGKNDAFVINGLKRKELISKSGKNSERIKVLATGKEVKRNTFDFQDKYLLFTGFDDDIPKEYPEIQEELDKHKEALIKRYDKGENYWNLRACAYYEEMQLPKIIYPRINNRGNFYFDEKGEVFLLDNNFFISTKSKAILALLNSKLVYFYLKNVCTTLQGGFYDFRRDKITSIPVNNNLNSIEQDISILADNLIDYTDQLNKNESNFINLLKSKFEINTFSKKLQNWHELEFGEFLLELEKARKKSAKENETEYSKLSLGEDAEWIQYFKEQKQKAEELKALIDKTDKEIDQMVYELYGLTQEEIEIVENATK